LAALFVRGSVLGRKRAISSTGDEWPAGHREICV
jgi:hypothetical protein